MQNGIDHYYTPADQAAVKKSLVDDARQKAAARLAILKAATADLSEADFQKALQLTVDEFYRAIEGLV